MYWDREILEENGWRVEYNYLSFGSDINISIKEFRK